MIVTIPFLPFRGFALWPFVFVKRRGDAQCVAHERVHLEQQKRGWLIGFLLAYFLSRTRRAHYEAQAYAASVRAGMTIQVAASAMSGYKLGMSVRECSDLIRTYL